MISTKYGDLLSEVIPELEGAPEPTVLLDIRNTVIDFCNGSRVWRVWLDPIDLVAGENTYDIQTTAGTDIVELMSVKLRRLDRDLVPASEDQLDRWESKWRERRRHPEFYTQRTPDTVTLACVPPDNHPGDMLLSVALQPDRTSKAFPGWIYTKYWDGILSGVKARMMAKSGMPWSNPKLAMYYKARYDAELAKARTDGARSLVRSRTVSRSNH